MDFPSQQYTVGEIGLLLIITEQDNSRSKCKIIIVRDPKERFAEIL